MTDIIKEIEVAGGQALLPRNSSAVLRNALAERVKRLRAEGHGLAVGEVVNSGEEMGEISVIHYKSCEKCKKGVL
jgi:hypothetical protein